MNDLEGGALNDLEGGALNDIEGGALNDTAGGALNDAEGGALYDAERGALNDALASLLQPAGWLQKEPAARSGCKSSSDVQDSISSACAAWIWPSSSGSFSISSKLGSSRSSLRCSVGKFRQTSSWWGVHGPG